MILTTLVFEDDIKVSLKGFMGNIVTTSLKSTTASTIQEASIVIKTLIQDDRYLKYLWIILLTEIF